MTNTTTNSKVTKVEYFEMVKGFVPSDRTDLIEFLDKQIAQTIKKNSYKSPNGKPSKTVQENAVIREQIFDAIASCGEPVNVATLSVMTEFESYPKGKITALVSQLVKAERVTATKVKGVNVYSVTIE